MSLRDWIHHRRFFALCKKTSERDALAHLGEKPVAPDLSGSILDRVHHARPFLCARSQKKVCHARWAAMGLIVVGAGALGYASWALPEKIPGYRAPSPISTLVDRASQDAASGMARLDMVRSQILPQTTPEPINHMSARETPVPREMTARGPTLRRAAHVPAEMDPAWSRAVTTSPEPDAPEFTTISLPR